MAVEQAKAHAFKNTLLWGVAVILLVASLVANYTLPLIPWPLRLLAWIVIVAVVLGLLLLSDQGKHFWNFAKLARNELRKVAWPTRAETTQSTIFVAVMVVILALLLWGIDAFWAWLVTSITV